MSLSRRKRKGNISMGKLPPPVGFQIIPASAAAGTNAASMRPTFSFLASNADELNKRISNAQVQWKLKNPTMPDESFPGIADPYGTMIDGKPQMIGSGGQGSAAKCSAKPGCIWQYWKDPPECRDVTGKPCGT